ncbi:MULTISPECIES: hypothetical protein [unclassified Bradyrhizobium]|uniref:hypothetical protein n=1 Tax=unclassified Bradyrhizobium TaxID=2631580 RepID=UPI0024E07F09|nr:MULTISPECIES: hypothetical protein [unclassified Bradyrhizobium]
MLTNPGPTGAHASLMIVMTIALDTSGKSGAFCYRQKNHGARAEHPAAGFLFVRRQTRMAVFEIRKIRPPHVDRV